MPALPEDTSSYSPTASAISSPPTLPRTPLFSSPNRIQPQTTIVEGMASTIHTDQRLASLAGATARRTAANSFVVAIEIMSNENSILDIIGNPTMLCMWCDAVPSLIVTECNASARRDRQHDAEWMEATTPNVIPPPNSSCMYALFRTIQSSLGFPSFGRITMLVERQRKQVAVTVGTFDGGIDVYHKLEVQPLSGGKVRVTDDVRLQFNDESGTWSSLQLFFLPDLGDHMNQAVSSMARLRFLVERGENPARIGYTPPVLPNDDGDDMTPLL
ncbi:hypothetical protein FisN_15Lh071 [Fistulifera solaris]|uniref:Uncharacterized protein n=1 Tax=Fistulifera solaris TaxID=1519565 RepID=A0A1Z5KAZ6_FISSO|nr:hypothetical protein FisN_15Lh071 [Fistulifera solaris]|eukprot:GAX23356.1 hypothetical protein FisN_15Lh071 [Fistulifera solaris]